MCASPCLPTCPPARPCTHPAGSALRTVAGMPPEAAVTRWLRIWWPDDEEWYEGEVREFNAATGQHRVWYLQDGQVRSFPHLFL